MAYHQILNELLAGLETREAIGSQSHWRPRHHLCLYPPPEAPKSGQGLSLMNSGSWLRPPWGEKKGGCSGVKLAFPNSY